MSASKHPRRQQARAKALPPPFPALGTRIAGGIFAGIVAAADGGEDYALIIGRDLPAAPFDDQQAAAKRARGGGHRDWVVSGRSDYRVAMANAGHLFERTWYWTSEQHASRSDYAWLQFFDDGFQSSWRKGDELRARLVRRLPISQFIHSLERGR